MIDTVQNLLVKKLTIVSEIYEESVEESINHIFS